jgi:hypothetical protein
MDYAAAKPWFERSLRLRQKNTLAQSYLQVLFAEPPEAGAGASALSSPVAASE